MNRLNIWDWARFVAPWNCSEQAWRCAWALARALGHDWAGMDEPKETEDAGAGAHVLEAWRLRIVSDDEESPRVGVGPEGAMAGASARLRLRWSVSSSGRGYADVIRPVPGRWTPLGPRDESDVTPVDVALRLSLDGGDREAWLHRLDIGPEALERHFAVGGDLLRGLESAGWTVREDLSGEGLIAAARTAAAREAHR